MNREEAVAAKQRFSDEDEHVVCVGQASVRNVNNNCTGQARRVAMSFDIINQQLNETWGRSMKYLLWSWLVMHRSTPDIPKVGRHYAAPVAHSKYPKGATYSIFVKFKRHSLLQSLPNVFFIRLEARFTPNIGLTLRGDLAVFTRLAITPPEANRFG